MSISTNGVSTRARRALATFLENDASVDAPGGMTWEEIERDVPIRRLLKGAVLCRQGTPSDAMYVVVSGRLRVVLEKANGEQRALSEIGRGETVGEMGMLTGEPR